MNCVEVIASLTWIPTLTMNRTIISMNLTVISMNLTIVYKTRLTVHEAHCAVAVRCLVIGAEGRAQDPTLTATAVAVRQLGIESGARGNRQDLGGLHAQQALSVGRDEVRHLRHLLVPRKNIHLVHQEHHLLAPLPVGRRTRFVKGKYSASTVGFGNAHEPSAVT
jgi:hypothetical protein